jgi:DNA-binding IclR family transcriptional regulator
VTEPRLVPLIETEGLTSGTGAASRVADVLLLFTSGPASLGVSAIARELGLSKAVVHRILQSLASRQVVVADQDTRGYRLGSAAVALGARALRDLDLRRAARPILRRLRDDTNETTTLSELLGNSRVYLDQFTSTQEIKMTVELGTPHALHAGGTGKVMLAFLPDEIQHRLLSGRLEPLTDATIVDPETLTEQLQQIRATGFSVSLGERQQGAGSVAAPVFDVDGEIVGAISICGPVGRFDAKAIGSYGPSVRAAAEEVSRALGWASRHTDDENGNA